AFGLRPDLAAAIDDDRVAGLAERERLADRLAAALVDDRHGRTGDDVLVVAGCVGETRAGRLPALLAERELIVGLRAIDLIARRLQIQLDLLGRQVALRSTEVRGARIRRAAHR